MINGEKKKRGRPVGYRKKNSATAVIPNVRVTEKQLNAYKARAAKENKTLSAWVKDTLSKQIDVN